MGHHRFCQDSRKNTPPYDTVWYVFVFFMGRMKLFQMLKHYDPALRNWGLDGSGDCSWRTIFLSFWCIFVSESFSVVRIWKISLWVYLMAFCRYGIVLIEIITRRKISTDLQRSPEDAFALNVEKFLSILPPDCPTYFRDAVIECCMFDPEKRCSLNMPH